MSLNTILATAPLTTTNYILKATGTTIGNSLIWDNGTNVGIGNTNTSYTLDVSGSLRNTTSAYFATTSGSVGIGTTNTNNVKLEVSATTIGGAEYSAFTTNQDGGVASKYSFWRTYGGGSTAFRAAYVANYNQDDSNSSANDQRLVFATKSGTAEPTTKMTITGAGNVGIGTSSPSTLLQINTAARTSGTNVNILTLSDTVTGVQTSGYGVRIVGTSNNGSAVSAIAFEADGGTNNDTAIAFYTQSTANALTRRLTILRNGQLQILQTANTYGDGLRFINTANNYWTIVTGGDNTLYTGYNSADKASLTSAGVWSTTGGGTSDKRKKQNIEYIETSCIDSIKMLKPVKFEFINNPEKTRRGFIAQDVLEVIPDLVLGDGELEGGTYGLDYDGILALAVKSIQEQQSQIQSLQEQINILAK